MEAAKTALTRAVKANAVVRMAEFNKAGSQKATGKKNMAQASKPAIAQRPALVQSHSLRVQHICALPRTAAVSKASRSDFAKSDLVEFA
jgi:hypothetical protein